MSNGVEVTLNYIVCFAVDGMTAVLCNVVNQVIPYTQTHGKRSNRSNNKTVKGFCCLPLSNTEVDSKIKPNNLKKKKKRGRG